MKLAAFSALRRSLLCLLLVGAIALPASFSHADQKAVAEARKAESEAKANLAKAQKALETVKDTVKAKDPAYATAQKELNQAKGKEESAQKAAAERARSSTEYLAAKKKFDDADTKVKELQLQVRAAGASTNKSLTDQMSAATAARADAKTAMEKIENEAVASDPKVAEAQSAHATAKSKLEELDKKLEAALATDKDYEAAKKELDDATTKLEEAKQKVQEEIKKNKEERGKRGNKGGGAAGGAGGN